MNVKHYEVDELVAEVLNIIDNAAFEDEPMNVRTAISMVMLQNNLPESFRKRFHAEVSEVMYFEGYRTK